jgi:hypothetical protein
MKYLSCLVFAIVAAWHGAAGAQASHAIPSTDTVRVAPTPRSDVDDILEAIALRAGIVTQGDNMRIT